MLPTFTLLITKHPRYFSVIGACIFILGAVLWFNTLLMEPTIESSTEIVQNNTTPHQKTEEEMLDEQFAILDSLKNSSTDTVPYEIKDETLTELSKNSSSTLSVNEKLIILNNLK